MYKTTDFLAGFFVIASMALTLWATIILGGHESALKELILGKEDTSLVVKFNKIAGLEVNHSVKVQGHEYGKVAKIELDPRDSTLLVELKLDRPIQVFEGYKIQITDESVLGGKAVYIDVGNKMGKKIESLYGKGRKNLVGVVSGNLMSEGGNILADNREDIRKIIKNIKQITDNIKEISVSVNEGNGIVSKLINDEEMGNHLKTSIADLNRIIGKVRKGEGFLGKLLTDETIFNDVKKLLKEAQTSLEDLREQAPITTFSGTLLGAF
ncbi:MAG: hypothetical protein COA79_10030 [Planctomycetota bacterium]|nr:MAG: hypothetical protein COA79_10030 [Planctomycetota bacterium]